MEPLIYRFLVLILLLAFVAHRAYYTRKLPPVEGETVDKLQPGPLAKVASLIFMLALASSLVYIFFPSWIAWAALPLPAWARWLGVGLTLAGFLLLEWSQRALGRNWSDQPRITQEQHVVQNGPYRWVRHPIYTAFMLILGSTLLISANWLVGGLWIAAVSLDIIPRMRYEEAAMLQQFGEEYRQYQQRTGRLIPFL
jgi:protein-S-isoprenylcysteine O-methyltransferase Ste14